MTLGALRPLLLVVALAGLCAMLVASARSMEHTGLPAPLPNPSAVGTVGLSLEDGVVRRVVERPAFRADRRPASVAYDPTPAPAPDTPPPPSVRRPVLAVSGIVWGVEPAAVVEGLPGIEGSSVLRRGDLTAGLRVVRIDRERVTIRGMDTTWYLTVREPWK